MWSLHRGRGETVGIIVYWMGLEGVVVWLRGWSYGLVGGVGGDFTLAYWELQESGAMV